MSLTWAHWIVVSTTAAAVIACVLLHYEVLRFISAKLPRTLPQRRRAVVGVILGLLAVHIAEIWIFAGCYYLLLQAEGFGELIGLASVTLLDCAYYSAVVFTTLGFGDIIPSGHIRFVTGTEAIAGLTFITWSASFTFVTMSQAWGDFSR